MAEFDIDLAGVQYKPPLPPNDYTFQIVKAELRQAANPNKQTNQREWMVACELKPIEPDFNSYAVFHNWSLAPGALAVEDPIVSVKKLYEVMGIPAGSKINTEDFLTMAFVGHTKLESYNGRLNPKIEKFVKKVS